MDQQNIWRAYYSGTTQVFHASPFAESVLPLLRPGAALLDLGCGNGRDSVYFYRSGMTVTALDSNEEAIALLRRNEPGVRAVCQSALTSDVFAEESFDAVYTRFFIHTLTEPEEAEVLRRCHTALRPGGRLYVETRTDEDELCGVGERISDNEWLEEGHYRRFLRPGEFRAAVERAGFRIAEFRKSRGLAPFDDQDPVILRVTAEKP